MTTYDRLLKSAMRDSAVTNGKQLQNALYQLRSLLLDEGIGNKGRCFQGEYEDVLRPASSLGLVELGDTETCMGRTGRFFYPTRKGREAVDNLLNEGYSFPVQRRDAVPVAR